MSIKIEVRKFVNAKGNKVAAIVKVEGMKSRWELPDEYTKHEPCTWFGDGKIEHTQGHESVHVGYEYPYERIVAMIEQVKKCGDHLHEVNLRIKKDIAEWTKNETFTI